MKQYDQKTAARATTVGILETIGRGSFASDVPGITPRERELLDRKEILTGEEVAGRASVAREVRLELYWLKWPSLS